MGRDSESIAVWKTTASFEPDPWAIFFDEFVAGFALFLFFFTCPFLILGQPDLSSSLNSTQCDPKVKRYGNMKSMESTDSKRELLSLLSGTGSASVSSS